jgi:hypothetical protein
VRKVTQKEQSCHQSEPCNLLYASTLSSLKWLHFAKRFRSVIAAIPQ